MVITKLIGGLGNQMFQYAVGRRVSLLNNTELGLDISDFSNTQIATPRKYSLDVFSISGRIATKEEVMIIKPVKNIWAERIKNILHLNKGDDFSFNPKILKTKDNSYLEGYWQSEKYFKDIEDIIRKDFTLKNPLGDAAQKIENEINKSQNPVSVHIRRGDYITDKTTNLYHGTCSPEYYEKAIEIIKKGVDSASLFIFSDDIDWVKNNLSFNLPTIYVSQKGIADYEEMILMSYCKHNVIANSSFSWWGAWLNNHKDKLVIAPRKWFNAGDANSADLIPDNWIKI
jgi:hypothetical protein